VFTFKELIEQESLPSIKLYTNELEKKYLNKTGRSVNIDPGYLLESRFILATGKDYSHRVYLGSGIYADLTLYYKNGSFQTLPWTYPDYGNEAMIRYFCKIRDKYKYDRSVSL